MKKRAEQKTKGHKATGTTGTISPVSTHVSGALSKDKITSLKDKAAAKTKKKR